ncbi:hypothetical protein TanjilG_25774 [Lupinus angustifolius]|uniref:Uncharacterized protein n=1 Tax=Lupinus angustifolius TaxID=3871 RepID=A0A394DCS6_LUPAN|nr:hypothetical protein TanjilG_25774 [Lupinus angustifolius]
MKGLKSLEKSSLLFGDGDFTMGEVVVVFLTEASSVHGDGGKRREPPILLWPREKLYHEGQMQFECFVVSSMKLSLPKLRYLKQAIVDKNPVVANAAIVSALVAFIYSRRILKL